MSSRILAGRYELLDKIGEGGMAVVFKSRDRLLNRYVAIKILRPEFTKDSVFIESFKRESQMAAGLIHPNIVSIYDVGKEGNIYYIVMELMDGRALSDIIKDEGALDPQNAANIARQIASALSAAHKNKLIHRDVKPHNIMFGIDGTAKITDFGIAKKVTGETLVSEQKENVMGSVHYFSPEQARGGYVDEKSDIYSLGICLYEMLTGKVPFDGETAVEVAVKHMNEAMIPPTQLNPNIPQDLEDIVMKATDKNPENRYRTADEMITALSFVSYNTRHHSEAPKEEHVAKPLFEGETPEHFGDELLISREAFSEGFPFDEDDFYVKKYVPAREKKKSGADESTKSETEPKPKRCSVKKHKPEKTEKKFLLAPQRYIAVVLAVVLAIPVSAGIFSLFNKEASISNKKENTKIVEITVPPVVGLSLEEATKKLKAQGLKLEVDLELVSKDVPEGQIMSQTPSEGSVIKSNQTVRVNISKGSVSGSVPNITGKSVKSAETVLNSYNYRLIVSSYQESKEIGEGYIISQNPGTGTQLDAGGTVYVVVSSGNGQSVELDIVGKTYAEARQIIQDAGYGIGLSTNKPSDTIEYGCVTDYKLNGKNIDLTISSGVGSGGRQDENTAADGYVVYRLDYSSHTAEIAETAFTVNIAIVDDLGSRTDHQSCITENGANELVIQGSGTDGAVTIYSQELSIIVQLSNVNFTEHTYTVITESL